VTTAFETGPASRTPSPLEPLPHQLLAVLAQHRMATTSRLHDLLRPDAARLTVSTALKKLRRPGLVDYPVLPQSNRSRAWYLTGEGARLVRNFPAPRGRPLYPITSCVHRSRPGNHGQRTARVKADRIREAVGVPTTAGWQGSRQSAAPGAVWLRWSPAFPRVLFVLTGASRYVLGNRISDLKTMVADHPLVAAFARRSEAAATRPRKDPRTTLRPAQPGQNRTFHPVSRAGIQPCHSPNAKRADPHPHPRRSIHIPHFTNDPGPSPRPRQDAPPRLYSRSPSSPRNQRRLNPAGCDWS
jgi:hypothetical protein